VRVGRRDETRATLRRVLLAATVFALGVLSILWAARYPERIFAGDPLVYRLRVEEIFRSGLPYLDVPFEHLPVAIVPMLIAWWTGGAASQSTYVVAFAAQMTMCMAVITALIDRTGELLNRPGSGTRWLLLSIPLLPVVVFRNDPFSVLLAVLALAMVVFDRRGWWIPAVLGAFTKIWPASLAATRWRTQPIVSAGVGAVGVAAVALTFLPGFAERRNAIGIHAETVMGSVIGLSRAVGDGDVGVILTTAAYLEVGGWAVVVNALVGLGVFVAGLIAMTRATSMPDRLVCLGTVVAGVILTSGLFSIQYVLWLLPFIALDRRRSTLVMGGVLALVSFWLTWIWSEAAIEGALFYAGVTVRNVLVIAAAAMCAAPGVRPRTERATTLIEN